MKEDAGEVSSAKQEYATQMKEDAGEFRSAKQERIEAMNKVLEKMEGMQDKMGNNVYKGDYIMKQVEKLLLAVGADKLSKYFKEGKYRYGFDDKIDKLESND